MSLICSLLKTFLFFENIIRYNLSISTVILLLASLIWLFFFMGVFVVGLVLGGIFVLTVILAQVDLTLCS